MVWLGKDSCRSTAQNKNKNSPTDQRSYISHLSSEMNQVWELSPVYKILTINATLDCEFFSFCKQTDSFTGARNMSCCSLKVAGSNPVLGKFLNFFFIEEVKNNYEWWVIFIAQPLIVVWPFSWKMDSVGSHKTSIFCDMN